VNIHRENESAANWLKAFLLNCKTARLLLQVKKTGEAHEKKDAFNVMYSLVSELRQSGTFYGAM